MLSNDDDDVTSTVTKMLHDIDFNEIRNDKQLLMVKMLPRNQ